MEQHDVYKKEKKKKKKKMKRKKERKKKKEKKRKKLIKPFHRKQTKKASYLKQTIITIITN